MENKNTADMLSDVGTLTMQHSKTMLSMFLLWIQNENYVIVEGKIGTGQNQENPNSLKHRFIEEFIGINSK